ncbi:MAG: recombinase family protein [Eggerthella lenta]
MARTYGYARVSTREQNLDRQMDALREFGVAREDIFADKASGKDFERPQWIAMKEVLREGDVLVVKSIDRFGRSYEEIIEQWRDITKVRGAAVVVLDMPLLDTRRERDGITGVLIGDIVLQLLSYVAQVERESIHQRQAEGIAAAKAAGSNSDGRRREGRDVQIHAEGVPGRTYHQVGGSIAPQGVDLDVRQMAAGGPGEKGVGIVVMQLCLRW